MSDHKQFTGDLIIRKYPELLDILLLDQSSKKNIMWCTDNYLKHGIKPSDYIKKEQLIHHRSTLIKPRVLKTITEQKRRIKDMAEVFTPSYICNHQNNLIDNEWFGYEGTFNIENDKSWTATDKVIFKNGKTWQDYVNLERLEITCGEAPYITSIYDATTGKYIKPSERIGLLDRKLRVISENVTDKEEWITWALTATKRVYGYEWQGDSLLIARENVLVTFKDFYEDKFSEECPLDFLLKVAEIVSWNLWQMDGMKYVVPNSCHYEERKQTSLFGSDVFDNTVFCEGCLTGNNKKHNGIYSKVKDWKKKKVIKFIDILDGDKNHAT